MPNQDTARGRQLLQEARSMFVGLGAGHELEQVDQLLK
jgi:hypothetical protein